MSTGYRSYLLVYWSEYGAWYLNNPAAAETPLEPVLVIFYAQSVFFQHIAAVCKWLFKGLIINSYWEKSRRIMSLLRAVVCVFLQKTTGVGTSFRQSTGLFVWKFTPLNPVFFVSKPAHRSILITIQIVIDLPYLGPGAIRSHLLSLPYWKGKHSWCCRPKCLALGCSVGAMCLVHDGWMNSGYTFTPTHPTCSPVGGDWLSYCFWWALGSPSPSDVFCIAPQASHLILLIYSES